MLPRARVTGDPRREGDYVGEDAPVRIARPGRRGDGPRVRGLGLAGGLLLGATGRPRRLGGGDGPTLRIGRPRRAPRPPARGGLVWFDIRAEGGSLFRSAEPIRAEVDYANVGWVIRTAEGETVLHRNAENETRYDHRCWAGSGLLAHVTVWYEGAYRVASATVPLECD